MMPERLLTVVDCGNIITLQVERAHSSTAEQPAHNRLVPGSNPGGPTTVEVCCNSTLKSPQWQEQGKPKWPLTLTGSQVPIVRRNLPDNCVKDTGVLLLAIVETSFGRPHSPRLPACA